MKKAKYVKAALALLLALAVPAAFFSGLRPSEAAEEKKLSIVTTIFPEYDWVRAILGDEADRVELTCLLHGGTDPHSYQPTADDIIKIATCDLFIYGGGESDRWTADVLDQTENPARKVISLMEALGSQVKEEELLEGMEEEPAEAGEETEYDEHVWLSLKNAAVLCRVIADSICELDETLAESCRANCEAYTEELKTLDEAYASAVSEGSAPALLFGDRFPFRYLADDYGITCYAAFPGCSAETEASFDTILFLASKMDELKLPCVLTIENSDRKIARTIIENTSAKDQKILEMNSMQSFPAGSDGDDPTYLTVMQDNLEVLKEALKA